MPHARAVSNIQTTAKQCGQCTHPMPDEMLSLVVHFQRVKGATVVTMVLEVG